MKPYLGVKLITILDGSTLKVALAPTAGRPTQVIFKLEGIAITDEARAISTLERCLLADGMPRSCKAYTSGKDVQGDLLVTLYAPQGGNYLPNLIVNDELVRVKAASKLEG